jgi:sec-independent protein translocase protein TatA
MMFGLGAPELLIILGVGVLIFGPAKLPELGNSIGKALKGFKDGIREEEAAPPTPKDTPRD